MRYLLIVIMSLMFVGCVQTPTQSTQVVDDRPGLAFQLLNDTSGTLELKIDGVSYGAVSQYLAGENRLRIIDGSHLIELIKSGEVVFREQVYLGSGSDRIIKVGN